MAITFEELDAIDGERRRVLIAFSKELRERNGDGGSGASDLANAASQLKDADLMYLERKQNQPIPRFPNQTPLDVINYIKSPNYNSTSTSYDTDWTWKNFKDPQRSFNHLVAAAPPLPAAGGPSAAGGGDGAGGGGGGPGGGGPRATATLGFAAAPPPPPLRPTADGSPGGGAGVVKPAIIDSAAGSAAAIITSTLPAASNLIGRFIGGQNPIEAAGDVPRELIDAAKTAWQDGLTGGGVQSAYQQTVQAGVRVPPAGGGGGGPGGGPGGGGAAGAAAAAAAAAAGPTPLDAAAAKAKEEDDRLAAAAAARLAAAKDARPAIPADDEETEKLKKLQAMNPGTRLEVFCDDESKKRQYNQQLAELLGDNTYKDKENEKSAFFLIISPPKETRANSTPLPYVTNGDFLEILAKDSFPKYSNRGIRICKMDLDPSSEGVVMGCSRLMEQHWIDVKDEKNTTRIFIDKENFQNLAKYKNLLTAKFEEFLRGDSSNFPPNTTNNTTDKETIINAINGFGSVQNIVAGTAAPAPAPSAPQTSVAVKLEINDEEIKKKAQEFAEDFLQRRIIKGNLNCEKETTLATFENQEIGHVKVVRPHADQEKIEVYIVGNSNLKHVNLALDRDKIMQIPISGITAVEIKDVKYYNVGNSTQLSKQKINPEALKVKVNVFVKGDNEWIRHKIRKGGDQSKEKVDSIFAAFEGDAPKIFTIEKNKNSVEIGEGRSSPYRDGDHDKINIKKKDGKYLVTYGGEKNHLCSSFLSTEYGCYWSNPVITKINGTYVSLQKKKKIYGKPSYTVGKYISAIITVEDENTGEIVDLKIEQVGHLADKNLFDCFRARNKIQVTEISKKTKTPLTHDVEDAVSTIPSSAPSPSIRNTMISSCFGGR